MLRALRATSSNGRQAVVLLLIKAKSPPPVSFLPWPSHDPENAVF